MPSPVLCSRSLFKGRNFLFRNDGRAGDDGGTTLRLVLPQANEEDLPQSPLYRTMEQFLRARQVAPHDTVAVSLSGGVGQAPLPASPTGPRHVLASVASPGRDWAVPTARVDESRGGGVCAARGERGLAETRW